MLAAPSSYHRLRFRDVDKERLLLTSTAWQSSAQRFWQSPSTASSSSSATSSSASTVAIPATVFSALVFRWFWYGLPLARAALELQSQEQKWQHSSKGMSY